MNAPDFLFVSIVSLITAMATAMPAFGQDQSPEELFKKAQAALKDRKFEEAIALVTKVIELKPDFAEGYSLRGLARGGAGKADEGLKDLTRSIELKPTAGAYMIRGQLHSELDHHDDAIADFDKTLESDRSVIAAIHHRGRERFKKGEIGKSIADFDHFIELDPTHKNQCWERGLSRYYAKQFDKAKQSFEDYHKVGPGDIENGLWRMLSYAESAGLAAAQRDLYKYEPKRRPPFPLLYDLYAGKSTPADVLAHAQDGATDDDRRARDFYTHLYLGMWFVATKDRPAATEHLEKAIAIRSTDYMWYVARVQLSVLKPPDAKK